MEEKELKKNKPKTLDEKLELEKKMEEDIKFEETTEPQVKKSPEEIKKTINEMEALFQDEPQTKESNILSDLAGLDLTLSDTPNIERKTYDTELLENITKIAPTLSSEQVQQLVDYVKGTQERPEFMDIMLTQTNNKLVETLKVMTVLQLLRLPALQDYLNVLQHHILDSKIVENMSYEDMSAEAVNIQKEMSDILSLGLKVCQSTSRENQVPTKVEKLANALMAVSDATRQRIEEIIAQDLK